MSHIPSSAMPHAGATGSSREDSVSQEGGASEKDGASNSALRERAGKVADTVRAHPKTAAAAGAAVLAGAVAAAAIPLMRGKSSDKAKGSSRKSSKAG